MSTHPESKAMPNASEALYGFVAWLTTRARPTIMSARHNCAEPARLVEEFCKANHLEDIRDDCFPGCFVMPDDPYNYFPTCSRISDDKEQEKA